MRLLDLLDLAPAPPHGAAGSPAPPFRDVEVRAVRSDSAQVRPGDLFVALKGTRLDGHDFVAEAVARGAVAVAAERPVPLPSPVPLLVVGDGRTFLARAAARVHDHPGRALAVVGITGTNGKTTTSFLLHAILERAGVPTALLGTVCHRIGERCLPSGNTTPGPVELQGLLAEARDEGFRAAVLEVSSHALDQRRVEAVPFRAGVFTNLSHEHLDYHGTLEAYARAKRRLFEMLERGAAAVLNGDDPWSGEFRGATAARVWTFGLGDQAQIRGRLLSVDLQGSVFDLETPAGRSRLRLGLVGPWNVRNALAAAAAACALGIPLEAVVSGLEGVRGVPGRVEPVDEGQPFPVLVDYAHTPAALESLLRGLRPLVPGRLHLVFGCGGDRDREKRPLMGRTASAWADRVVVTSDNPRSEDPCAILEEICAGMGSGGCTLVEPDRRTAIHMALSEAREGDLVLIAGKGHEDRQVFRETVVPFDDRVVAREALRRLGGPLGPLDAGSVRAGAA